MTQERFCIWRDSPSAQGPALREMLALFPDIQVLRLRDDSAVVLMTGATREQLGLAWPELQIEADLQHRPFHG